MAAASSGKFEPVGEPSLRVHQLEVGSGSRLGGSGRSCLGQQVAQHVSQLLDAALQNSPSVLYQAADWASFSTYGVLIT